MVEVPDRLMTHAPAQCRRCGRSLEEVSGTVGTERRQVFDLPPLNLEVVEHRVVTKECPACFEPRVGEFPADVPAGASYGPAVKSLIVSLHNQHLIPLERTCGIFEDLFSQPISEGTLQSAVTECAAALEEIEQAITQAITQSEVAHFDETGMYIEGSRHWLHVASTEQWTHYAVHHQRGSGASQEIGILPNFQGRAIHDGWRSYLKYECEHGLCNAHHLRELTFLHEREGAAWAKPMIDLLLESKRAVDAAKQTGQTQLEAEKIKEIEQRYRQILREGLEVEQLAQPPPSVGKRGRQKQTKAKNLLDRLEKHEAETLAFVKDFRVPFDNNLAERDLRMMKVQQKVSGCFRTGEGASRFCRIRGYISTLRKQGHHVLAALKSVLLGTPLVPNLPG
jgi:transposase